MQLDLEKINRLPPDVRKRVKKIIFFYQTRRQERKSSKRFFGVYQKTMA